MQADIKRVHIISRINGGWAVLKQGASRAVKVYPTREEAVLGSYPFLQLGYDLVIHRKDGSVEQFKKAPETALSGVSLDGLEKKAATKGRQNGTTISNASKQK